MESLIFYIQSAVLGIVEGLSEFLPISSTGHLIIFQSLFGFGSDNPEYVNMYTFVIQLGAILAVIVLYRKKIWDTIVHLIPKKGKFKESGLYFWLMIVLACVPGTIIQLLFDDLSEQYLFNSVSVAITLFLGGLLMIFMENRYRKKALTQSSSLVVTPKQALIIGAFQCLAIIPGMSRSASTIMGGWVAGLSTVAAAEFSFFLAIPVMVGMSGLKIIKLGGFGGITSPELIALLIGFVVSFLVALVVVKAFISYLQKKPMRIFAYYRMIFAILVLIGHFLGWFSIG